MLIQSKNQNFSVYTSEDNKNNIDSQRDRPDMQVKFQPEDLQAIAIALQEHLRAEVPSGEQFRVKCVVQNHQLMILTQHQASVLTNAQQVFLVLESALEELPTQLQLQVELFLRIAGEKLPYAKHSLFGLGQSNSTDTQVGEEITTNSSLTYSVTQEEAFNPMMHEADLSSVSTPTYSSLHLDTIQNLTPSVPDTPLLNKERGRGEVLSTSLNREPLYSPKLQYFASLPLKSILVGAALTGITFFGGGSYVLSRPCVMLECKEILTAKKLQQSSPQLTRSAKSEKELTRLQQQFALASDALKIIPSWAPRHQQAEQLATSLSGQSEKIKSVIKALQAASLAEQKNQTPVNSLQELQTRQQLWRNAIAPLEAIAPDNQLYGLVQRKLSLYRLRLQTVNQQLLGEAKWLQKLTKAKSVANTALSLETAIKSPADLQKVQFTWQLAVNALSLIPQTSSAYQQAQELLLDYKPKLATARDYSTKELLAAKAYQQALNTTNQASAQQQQNQWLAALASWEIAINAAKQIPADSFYYSQAQQLIEPLTNALRQAQQKAQVVGNLQQTRTDLVKTCSSGIRICTFTIDSKGITVKISPEYQQALENSLANANPEDPSSFAGITNHLQVLQEALGAISENANLALVVYDAQGQIVHTRSFAG